MATLEELLARSVDPEAQRRLALLRSGGNLAPSEIVTPLQQVAPVSSVPDLSALLDPRLQRQQELLATGGNPPSPVRLSSPARRLATGQLTEFGAVPTTEQLWAQASAAMPGYTGGRGTRALNAGAPTAAAVTAATTPARQTSFTNADAAGAASRVNTMPAVQAPEEISPLEQTLNQLIGDLTPRPSGARLIRAAPEAPRMGSNIVEARANREAYNRAVDQRNLETAVGEGRADRRQAGTATALDAVTGLQAQREAIQRAFLNQLAIAESAQNTPEGRLAAARAQQIEALLGSVGTALETQQLTLPQAINTLGGQQGRLSPVAGLTGETVGVYDENNQLRLFSPEELAVIRNTN